MVLEDKIHYGLPRTRGAPPAQHILEITGAWENLLGGLLPSVQIPRAAAAGCWQEELMVGLSRSLLMLSHADPLAQPVICACILRTTPISLHA